MTLNLASWNQIALLTTASKKKLESRVGRLSDEDIVRVNRAVVVFLGLAGPGARWVPKRAVHRVTAHPLIDSVYQSEPDRPLAEAV